MKKVNLHTIITENNLNINIDFEEIKERALNAMPRILIQNENVQDVLNNLLTSANSFAEKEYSIITDKGIDFYLELATPYIKAYLTDEEIKNIWGFHVMGFPRDSDKIKKIFSNAFINNRFKLIVIDKELFENYDYYNLQNKNKNFEIWENCLNKIELEEEIIQQWETKIKEIRLIKHDQEKNKKNLALILSCGLETFIAKKNNPKTTKQQIIINLKDKYDKDKRTIERYLQQIDELETKLNLPPISQYIKQK